ncbi:MAG: hypothetical protein IPJ84_15135 [Bdellovibrionales bacterium]|nr:hypothetical protein [Bdellovibrionales bacterium]
MKFDYNKAEAWINAVDQSLVGLKRTTQASKSPILLLGAGVLELYAELGWIAPLRRGKTGDLDLSVGLVASSSEYAEFVEAFKKLKYRPDNDHPYRWHSPKAIPGAMTYVDILSHPATDSVGEDEARASMKVANEFSLDGMRFAMDTGYSVYNTIRIPRFVGMIALKLYAYRNSPDKRRKDLADVIEVCWSLVEKGHHFDFGTEWTDLESYEECQFVREALGALAGGESTTWDIEEIRQELLTRSFSSDEIDTTISTRLKDFLEIEPE